MTRIDHNESGAVFMVLIVMIAPLVLVVGSFTAAMNARSERLRGDLDQERAMLAAESGVDLGIWLGQAGWMADGYDFFYPVGSGSSFRLESTYLRTDGVDNDGDAQTDEADEDVYQIIVTGRYRNTARRVAAYLGPVPLIPMTFEAAMTVQNPAVTIDLKGTPLLSGHDTNIDGSAGDPANDVPGLSIASPGTIADLLAELSPSEQSQIIGAGGTPSLGVSASTDLTPLIDAVRNSADLVLTNQNYANLSFGDGAAGTTTIAYRDGDLRLTGGSTGAGILVVTGDLTLAGHFEYDGVIIVLGNINAGTGTAVVRGAIVQGPAGSALVGKGTFDLAFSAEALTLANSSSGSYVAFNGWQEISR